MDPNETLKAIRYHIDKANESTDLDAKFMHRMNATMAFANLDEWLSKGGFLPTDWARGQVGKW